MDTNDSTMNFQQFCNIMTSLALCGRISYFRLLAKVFISSYTLKSAIMPAGVIISSGRDWVDDNNEFAKTIPNEDSSSMKALRFAELCDSVKYEHDPESEKELDLMLKDLYHDRFFVSSLMFLLKKADAETIKQFAACYIGDDEAQYASVDIIVRKNDKLERITGNIGHFLIYMRKGEDSEEKLLRFTNQASMIYYLMFLISRCQKSRKKDFVELRKNQDPFLELYRQVYDEPETTLLFKYKNLLNREDLYGNVRAGRLNEIIYDIRRHLEERFMEYDESFKPYAMTAKQPLTVSAERIHFEGEAQQLLCLEFM